MGKELMVELRNGCNYKGLNHSLERSCTKDNLCPQCWMDRDVERNSELYKAMAVNED